MTRRMQIVLLLLLPILFIAWQVLPMKHDEYNRKERFHRRLREEALNVSMYADSLLTPFQSSAGIAKNGTATIHELVDRLQSFADKKRVKKYFIGHFTDADD